MSERDPLILIEDMLQAVDSILEYVGKRTFNQYQREAVVRDAVLRNLTVLGEAAHRVPQEFCSNYPTIEWKKIARSRHVIVHDYFSVDHEIVWKIVTVYLPPLKDELEKVVDSANEAKQ